VFRNSIAARWLTAGVTGGWGEKGLEMGNRRSSEKTPKNAQNPSHPVHAMLGSLVGCVFHQVDKTPRVDNHYRTLCFVIYFIGRSI